MSTAKEKLKEIYTDEDWKNIYLNVYKESGCTMHEALTQQTTNVPFFNDHEDEILDYLEDSHRGKQPLIEKIIEMACHDIVMVKSIAVQYFIEMFACEVVGLPYFGEVDLRKQRQILRSWGIFDYKEGAMVPPPPDFERKKGSAHNTQWQDYYLGDSWEGASTEE